MFFRTFISATLAVLILLSNVASQTAGNLAPGAPGRDAQWESAGKAAVGTSVSLESKVWFTLSGDGAVTEIYYPTVDVANTRILQFIVVNLDRRTVETEVEDTTHRIESLDPMALTFRQTNTARSGAYTITKIYTTDPARSTVLVDVEFRPRTPGAYRLFVYYDPALNNSGMHDSAWTQDGALLSSDADKASALISSVGFAQTSNGYFGTESDGLNELRRGRRAYDWPPPRHYEGFVNARTLGDVGDLLATYERAANGNVVQIAQIREPQSFMLALGFGREADEALTNARASLQKGFARCRTEYEAGWHEYVNTLRRVQPQYQRQFDMAAMVLKAHEDKTFRGAMIASLSIPWGGGANANEPNVGGYHLVWSRDLYQVATAFLAMGDKPAADRALNYLFTVQQKPDGSFPQNSWLDGRPFWGSLQMDEVAYPLILAYQLGRTDNQTYIRHVRPAADFLVRTGPRTPQERWEEEAGYSPSTIAAEIAGLICAAEIARRNNDEASAIIYTAAADDWTRNVERWTATTTGRYGDRNYYLRITENDDPNDGAPLQINNGGGTFDEREIVDAGFLELVRLGVKPPDDPLIEKSVRVVDSQIMFETANGAAWYRYNHDGYGERADGSRWDGTGIGRLWALLTGERGEYELMRGERARAQARLDAMMRFANEGLMIPEQVWDRRESSENATLLRAGFRFGEGTGSATPLAWSMAGFVRLAASLEENRNVAMPDIVAARYAQGAPPVELQIQINLPPADVLGRAEPGSVLRFTGQLPHVFTNGARVFVETNEARREATLDREGAFYFDTRAREEETFVIIAAQSSDGRQTFFRRVRLNAASRATN